MQADMSALKDQMASMIEAMLVMKRLIESNAATTVATSIAGEADPALPSTSTRLRYGLPPNFTPLTVLENTDHAIPFTFERQPPQPVGDACEEPWEHAQGDVDSYPPFTTEGSTPNALPQPNIAGVFQPRPMQLLLFSMGGPPPAVEGREKLDLIEERLRTVEGFGDYSFVDMTNLCLVPDIVIPSNFKVPDFDRYKGTTCPKNHLKMYCRKMGAYSRDEKLLMHFFQDSLVGAAVIWLPTWKHCTSARGRT